MINIYPQSLGDYMKNWPSPESWGKICFALAGRPFNLDPQEKAVLAAIIAEGKRMDASQEEKRERWRERQSKSRKNTKAANVAENVTPCHGDTPTNKQTNKQTNEQTNEQTTKPNRAGAREVATASPSFGLGDVSPEVKAKAKSELEEMRETYLEQFSNAMRQAADCGNEDGPFYDKDIPAEYICCWITGSNAVGTWKAYVHKLGEEAVREECCLFQHERNAGENARNPAAALNARLNRLCEEKGGSDD